MSDTSSKDQNTDRQNTIGILVGELLKTLSKGSKAEGQDALKAVGAIYNLRVVPAFAPLGPNAVTSPPSRDTRGQRGPRFGPSKKDPFVKEIRDNISELNKQISKKSAELRKPLSEDDELIVRRNHLFRDLKEEKGRPHVLGFKNSEKAVEPLTKERASTSH
jgi:hypothetical protein